MSEWITISLGQICDESGGEIRTGPFGSQLHEADYSAEGIPVVMPKDIPCGKVDEATIARIPASLVRRLPQYILKEGDIVYGRRGDIGRKALITAREAGWLCGTGCLRITPGEGLVDPRFLFYRLGSPETVSAIANKAVGATMPNLNTAILRSVEITLPSLATQHRIAAILGAYDDLIEVNRRRVALLEDMARGLFEEWFVRFRFPGHEAVAMVDAPDGRLPEGWSWISADRLLHFDPKTQVRREGEKPFVSMGHLDTSTSVIAPHEWREGNSGAKFQTGDVLFARITPCLENGKTGLVRDLLGGVGFGSTEFIVMRAARAGSSFAYCLARSDRFRANAVSGMSGASGRQRARTDAVSAFTIATPPGSDVFDRFEAATATMLDAVGCYAKANAVLAASRDLLLPRLISGQLSVAAAERELKAA